MMYGLEKFVCYIFTVHERNKFILCDHSVKVINEFSDFFKTFVWMSVYKNKPLKNYFVFYRVCFTKFTAIIKWYLRSGISPGLNSKR